MIKKVQNSDTITATITELKIKIDIIDRLFTDAFNEMLALQRRMNITMTIQYICIAIMIVFLAWFCKGG